MSSKIYNLFFGSNFNIIFNGFSIILFLYSLYFLYKKYKTYNFNLKSEFESFEHLYCLKDENDNLKKDRQSNKFIVMREITDYFNERESLDINYRWISGIFTGIGILGTFVGIAWGLMDQSISLGDPKKSINFLNQLLDGMKTAFGTSILGIFFSILYIWVYESRFTAKKEYSLSVILSNFYNNYIVESPTMYLRIQAIGNESVLEASTAIQKAISKINTMVDPQELGRVISESIQTTITKELRPIFENINLSTSELRKTNHELSVYVRGELPKVFTDLQKALDSANQGIQSTNSSLLITRDNLEKQNRNFINLDSMLKTYIKDMGEVLTEQRKLFTEQMEHISQTTISTLNATKETVVDSINATKETSISLLEDVGSKVSTTIEDSNIKLQSTLSGVNESLVKTSDLVQVELTKFREAYTVLIEQFIDNQKNVLENTLKGYTENLISISEQIGKQLEQDYKLRKELNNSMNDQLDRLKTIVSMQQTIEVTIKDQLVKAANNAIEVYGKGIETNNNLLKQIISYKKEMETSLEKSKDSIVKDLNLYLEEQTKYLTKIISHFTSLIEIIGSKD